MSNYYSNILLRSPKRRGIDKSSFRRTAGLRLQVPKLRSALSFKLGHSLHTCKEPSCTHERTVFEMLSVVLMLNSFQAIFCHTFCRSYEFSLMLPLLSFLALKDAEAIAQGVKLTPRLPFICLILLIKSVGNLGNSFTYW